MLLQKKILREGNKPAAALCLLTYCTNTTAAALRSRPTLAAEGKYHSCLKKTKQKDKDKPNQPDHGALTLWGCLSGLRFWPRTQLFFSGERGLVWQPRSPAPHGVGGGALWLGHQVSSLLAREGQGPEARRLRRWDEEAEAGKEEHRWGGPLRHRPCPASPGVSTGARLELWTGLDRSQVLGEAGADVCSLPAQLIRGGRRRSRVPHPHRQGGPGASPRGSPAAPCHGYSPACPQALFRGVPPNPTPTCL